MLGDLRQSIFIAVAVRAIRHGIAISWRIHGSQSRWARRQCQAVARLAEGAEREPIWANEIALVPKFAEFEAAAGRPIPVLHKFQLVRI